MNTLKYRRQLEMDLASWGDWMLASFEKNYFKTDELTNFSSFEYFTFLGDSEHIIVY